MNPDWIDPKTVSVVSVLAALVAMFIYGRIMTTAQCERQMAVMNDSLQKTIAVYELRIAELCKDRDDYKLMVRATLEGLNRIADVKGAPPGKDALR